MQAQLTRRHFLGATAGSLFAAGNQAYAQNDKTILRAADSRSLDYPTVQALAFLDRYLRRGTGNQLGLQIFADAQLGGEPELIQHLQLGIIDVLRVNVLTLAQHVPLLAIVGHPHVFSSEAQVRTLLDSNAANTFIELVGEHNMVALSFFDAGARHLYNRLRPVNKPEDAFGMRLRVDTSPSSEQFVRAIGAQPVRLPVNQVWPALNAGLLDGAIDSLTTYVTLEHHRAAPYFSKDVLSFAPDILLMSQRAWNNLPEPQRNLIRAGAVASRKFMRPVLDRWSKLSKEQAIEQGVAMPDDAPSKIFAPAIEMQGEELIAAGAAKFPEVMDIIRSIRN